MSWSPSAGPAWGLPNPVPVEPPGALARMAPGDAKRFWIDFTPWLRTGATILGQPAVVAPSWVTVSGIEIGGGQFAGFVSFLLGVPQQRPACEFCAAVTLALSDGQIRTAELVVRVAPRRVVPIGSQQGT